MSSLNFIKNITIFIFFNTFPQQQRLEPVGKGVNQKIKSYVEKKKFSYVNVGHRPPFIKCFSIYKL